VSVVLPGRRDDRAHRSAYAVSSELVAAWPRQATGMVHGLTPADARRLHHVGAISRLEVSTSSTHPPGRRTVLVLSGSGGGHPTSAQVDAAAADAPDWSWRILGGDGEWTDDPASAIDEAAVIVIQAGESAVADVAARRRPAIVVPAARPFDEQRMTGQVLASAEWPTRVEECFPSTGWSELLQHVATLDAGAWQPWCDGHAADRMTELLTSFRPRRRTA
jgi:hypothetical protein